MVMVTALLGRSCGTSGGSDSVRGLYLEGGRFSSHGLEEEKNVNAVVLVDLIMVNSMPVLRTFDKINY